MGGLQLQMPELGRSLSGPALSLGDHRLRLDPDPFGFLPALRSGRTPPGFREAWMTPPWEALDRNALNGQVLAPPSRCAWSKLPTKPVEPRPGKPGDVLKAVYAIPCVRRYVDDQLAAVEAMGAEVWNGASTRGRIGLVAGGVPVFAGALVGGALLGPLNGVEVPVPGVPGLGAKLSLGSAAVPAGVASPGPEGAWSIQLSLDFAKLLSGGN